MSRVQSKDTKPEMLVRSLIHKLGYRFRLHSEHLPGKPDLVFPSRRKIVFIHGCYWHGHGCKRGARIPQTNRKYWLGKISRNKRRDTRLRKILQRDGWKVLVLWECQLKNEKTLTGRIEKFLSD